MGSRPNQLKFSRGVFRKRPRLACKQLNYKRMRFYWETAFSDLSMMRLNWTIHALNLSRKSSHISIHNISNSFFFWLTLLLTYTFSSKKKGVINIQHYSGLWWHSTRSSECILLFCFFFFNLIPINIRMTTHINN